MPRVTDVDVTAPVSTRAQTPWVTLVLGLINVVEDRYSELRRSLSGHGKLQLTAAFTHHQTSQMTVRYKMCNGVTV